MEDSRFRAGGEGFESLQHYVYKRINFHLENAINRPGMLLGNEDYADKLREAGERNQAMLDDWFFPPRNGREHLVQRLMWHFVHVLVHEEWEWLAKEDREHDLEYLTDLLIAGFVEPLLFPGFFSQERTFSSLHHEQLLYDLVRHVVTGNLDAERAAFLLPFFIDEFVKLHNEVQTLFHANRFTGRDPTDRLEEATKFRMTTYSYLVALVQVLAEKPPTEWNAPILQAEPDRDTWVAIQRVFYVDLRVTPRTNGFYSAPMNFNLQLSTVAPLVEEFLAQLPPEKRSFITSTRRFTETFARAQRYIILAEDRRARIPHPTGMDLIMLGIAEAQARRGPDELLDISDRLAQLPDPVGHREVEGECLICYVPHVKDPEANDGDGCDKDAATISKVPILFCPNCGTPFHEKCIINWFERRFDNRGDETCPNCRGIWLM